LLFSDLDGIDVAGVVVATARGYERAVDDFP
jgi:hypothetical protein